MMRVAASLPALTLLAALGACSVGPDFRPPDPPSAATYLVDPQNPDLVAAGIPGGEAQKIVESLDIPGQWWGVFQSPQLNNLIERALVANPDIKATAASLKIAQLNARAQRATLFPTIGLALGASQNQVAPILQSPLTSQNSIFGLFTAGLTLTYALDIWGGNRRQIESLESLAEQQCFQLEGAYLSLASNVVAAAILEASLRAQVEATRRIIAAQRETLGILQRVSGLGAIPGADVATQQAALAQAETTLPPLEKALAQQRNLLANLTGRTTNDPVAERFTLSDLKLPAELPLSLPSRMVEQRPDVRAAEANLHSAGALVGVAISNQLPQITLSVGVGTTGIGTDALFGPTQTSTNVGGSLLQTIIDGGALAAKKQAALAGLEQAEAQYRSSVLNAFRNVADTLNALEYDAITLKAAVEAERAAASSLAIARRRLELGDTTYVFVLIAELTYQQTQITRIQAQAARLTNTAALFQALGGGWWNRDGADTGARSQRSRCHAPTAAPAPGYITSKTTPPQLSAR